MKVLVLLSAYNGALYIKEQLNSIFAQEDVETHVLIRDDGSKDATLDIIRGHEEYDKRLAVLVSGNMGFSKSFHQLLRLAYTEYKDQYDYFAFADQDDVWYPEKLKIALSSLKNVKEPAAFVSNVKKVDAELNEICDMNPISPEKMTFASCLIDAYCLGCTMCFNKDLLEVYAQVTYSIPPSHDRWMLLLAKYFGRLIYDSRPLVLYRQHGKNVFGGVDTVHLPFMERLLLMRKTKTQIYDHAVCLMDSLSKAGAAPNKSLLVFVGYRKSLWGRIKLLTLWRELGFTRPSWPEDIKKRIKVLLGYV